MAAQTETAKKKTNTKLETTKQKQASTNSKKNYVYKDIKANEFEEKIEKPKIKKNELDAKTKFWYIFLCIVTFSIFYFIVQSKIKKQRQKVNTTKIPSQTKTSTSTKQSKQDSDVKLQNFKQSTLIDFNVNDLIEYLGSKKNIESLDASLSSLKVIVKDKTIIKQDEIKKLGAKGIMVSGQKISIIFGDNSNTIKQEIQKML